MTELTVEALRQELARELAPIRAQLAEARQEVGAVRQEVGAVRQELALVRPRVDGVPLLGAAIETLRHDVRTLRAAINDMARVNVTAGEIEALHTDIDKVQSAYLELGARLTNVERILEDLRR